MLTLWFDAPDFDTTPVLQCNFLAWFIKKLKNSKSRLVVKLNFGHEVPKEAQRSRRTTHVFS